MSNWCCFLADLHGALSGGSSLSLTKTGAGTLFFESTSSDAGNTEVRSGLVGCKQAARRLGQAP